MLTIKKRPYLPLEKERVTGESVPGTTVFIYRSFFSKTKELISGLGIIFFLLILFVIIKIIFSISGPGEFVLAVALGMAGLLFMLWRAFGYSTLKKHKKERTDEHAEVLTVNSSRAIKKENPFGPGMAFYVDVLVANEPKTLFLWGQRFDEMYHAGKFPNTAFIVVRSSQTWQLVNVEVFGSYFPAERSLAPFTKEELEKGVLHDVQVLDISFDEVK